MGGARAAAGLEALLEGFHPEAVLSLGFGGALDASVGVGDLVWGRKVVGWCEEKGPWGSLDLAHPLQPESWAGGSGPRTALGFLVSVERPVDKARVRAHLAGAMGPSVLEMETHALARALQGTGIPLMGLRAVSDEWDFDPAPVVRGWMDDDLRVRPWKVMGDVLRHPGRVALLHGLYRRSRMAAASLARGIGALLDS
jgi:hypothetical protein